MATPPFDAGALRHRLVLEAPAADPDGRRLWSQVAAFWAAIQPLGGEEAAIGGHLAGRASHRIVIRHRVDVTSAHRLRKGARTFAIRTTYDPDETRRALVILAEEDDR